MGFQGQLSSVSLTDIFQTLHMNRQTGTLSVGSPDGHRHIYFDTGQVAIVNYAVVDDVGTVINPLLLKGQVHGGIAQGLGLAVMEEIIVAFVLRKYLYDPAS